MGGAGVAGVGERHPGEVGRLGQVGPEAGSGEMHEVEHRAVAEDAEAGEGGAVPEAVGIVKRAARHLGRDALQIVGGQAGRGEEAVGGEAGEVDGAAAPDNIHADALGMGGELGADIGEHVAGSAHVQPFEGDVFTGGPLRYRNESRLELALDPFPVRREDDELGAGQSGGNQSQPQQGRAKSGLGLHQGMILPRKRSVENVFLNVVADAPGEQAMAESGQMVFIAFFRIWLALNVSTLRAVNSSRGNDGAVD